MGDIQVLQIGMDLVENAMFSVKHFTVKASFMAALSNGQIFWLISDSINRVAFSGSIHAHYFCSGICIYLISS